MGGQCKKLGNNVFGKFFVTDVCLFAIACKQSFIPFHQLSIAFLERKKKLKIEGAIQNY